MAAYYLAVDIGASSGRHILGHLENGRMVIEEIYRFANGLSFCEGEACWDLEKLFGHILSGMKKCRELGKIPVSMGIDTWGVDFVLLDADGQIIGNTVGYRDRRTEGMDQSVYQRIREDHLYYRTGIQKQIFNTIYQLQALKEKKSEYLNKASTLLLIPDYFHYLLTGVAVTEYTNATTTQLVSPITKDWDWELIALLGFPSAMFREIRKPGSLIGGLTPALRGEVGFDLDVVLPATHDTGSAVLAVPATEEHTLYLSSGTWSLLGVERRVADCSEESRVLNLTNEGGYDYRFRYLKNIMGLWMIQSVQKELQEAWRKELQTELQETLQKELPTEARDRYSFAELCDLAEKATIDSLVDCNADCFLAPASMTGEIQTYCRESGQEIPRTAGELARVIYRSLADCYGRTVRELEMVTGVRYPYLCVVGGGANAGYLNELTAKACNKKILAGPVEATAVGNLMVQMIHAGELPSLTAARASVRTSFDIKEWT